MYLKTPLSFPFQYFFSDILLKDSLYQEVTARAATSDTDKKDPCVRLLADPIEYYPNEPIRARLRSTACLLGDCDVRLKLHLWRG